MPRYQYGALGTTALYQPIYNNWTTHGTVRMNIQWIKADRKQSANRYGLGMYSKTINHNSYQTIGDTGYIVASYKHITAPMLQFGKEWRKFLHKDVHIFAGVDAQLAVGQNEYYSTRYRHADTVLTNYFSYYNTSLAATVGIRPFIGIRTDWNRFVIGYEMSMPFRYSFTQDNKGGIHPIDLLRINHQLSVGYRLNKRK